MKTVLDFGGPFIDLDARDERRNTALFDAIVYSNSHILSKTKLLLDRGSDIHARGARGKTCLHYAVLKAIRPDSFEEEMGLTTLLIQRGANIFVTDDTGRSSFDYAYECDHDERGPLGGYRGDLWDAALVRCGYGKYIRDADTRMIYFTEFYTREH